MNLENLMTNQNQKRCAGCGKPLEGKVIRLTKGKYKKGEFEEGREWGVLHAECFDRAVDSPDAALEEVRRQARQKVAA